MTNTDYLLALFAINLLTYMTFFYDKWSAKRGGWRIPEANLLLLSLLGGSPMGLLAMYSLRHKTRKTSFRILLPLMLMLHICLVLFLLLEAL